MSKLGGYIQAYICILSGQGSQLCDPCPHILAVNDNCQHWPPGELNRTTKTKPGIEDFNIWFFKIGQLHTSELRLHIVHVAVDLV